MTGLGGIGKTQLASEFVHRYSQYFAGEVFWLSFADPVILIDKLEETIIDPKIGRACSELA